MPRSAKKLARLHRVRSLQLDQVRADEVRAQARVTQESQLRARIAGLAATIEPGTAGEAFAGTMIAAAHYRDRLHQSASAAERRVEVAEQNLESARAATREARRDQSAIEKLIVREQADAALKIVRALETLPPSGRNRHDLC